MLLSLRQLLANQQVDYSDMELLIAVNSHWDLHKAKQTLVDMQLFQVAKDVVFQIAGDGYYQYIQSEDRYIKINNKGVLGIVEANEEMKEENIAMLIEAYTHNGVIDLERLAEDYANGKGVDNITREIAKYLGRKFGINNDGSTFSSNSSGASANTEKEQENDKLAAQLQQVAQMMQSAASASSNMESHKNRLQTPKKDRGNEFLR